MNKLIHILFITISGYFFLGSSTITVFVQNFSSFHYQTQQNKDSENIPFENETEEEGSFKFQFEEYLDKTICLNNNYSFKVFSFNNSNKRHYLTENSMLICNYTSEIDSPPPNSFGSYFL